MVALKASACVQVGSDDVKTITAALFLHFAMWTVDFQPLSVVLTLCLSASALSSRIPEHPVLARQHDGLERVLQLGDHRRPGAVQVHVQLRLLSFLQATAALIPSWAAMGWDRQTLPTFRIKNESIKVGRGSVEESSTKCLCSGVISRTFAAPGEGLSG